VCKTDKLVCEPGYRVRLAAARRVLDEVPLAGAALSSVDEQLADDIELVVARKDLVALHPAGLRVLPPDDLGVILEDVGQAGRREDALPEKVGFEAFGIRRIASAVVPPLIEGQKP